MVEGEIDVKGLKIRAQKAVEVVSGLKELELAYKGYLGPKGELTLLLRSLSEMGEKERKRVGKEANILRNLLQENFERKKSQLARQKIDEDERGTQIDITAPGRKLPRGHLHPLTHIQRKAQEIFQGMGFAVAEGPEIETEWYNFDALNIPADHPARDMWDTFWLKPKNAGLLLRTHTSPVQARFMEKNNPPLRIIAPGRIFRYEATDASHEINFYQLEGLMIGKDVSMANFKAIIEGFYEKFFEKKVSIRLRPSYFPFTEPSFEIDMRFGRSGWLEMMGAGMVHPNVLKAVGYMPREWQGFAFGMGLDRLAMMKYKINDVRLLYSGDLHMLSQF
jgi:phenylalanyl-tRNA synthetase alpha chain